ncbi:hypothetical protein F5144DRAFT_574867 [Chaetomium tenue]|uniref:Uncharacterized protein n=1 Tax=Chaetomium tenue TaxID=1854479 RepID=A0ACB7PDR5_9PEZI|nr:hypothetical protein F5144DRAFT_574867 [Chaetomium globosum]
MAPAQHAAWVFGSGARTNKRVPADRLPVQLRGCPALPCLALSCPACLNSSLLCFAMPCLALRGWHVSASMLRRHAYTHAVLFFILFFSFPCCLSGFLFFTSSCSFLSDHAHFPVSLGAFPHLSIVAELRIPVGVGSGICFLGRPGWFRGVRGRGGRLGFFSGWRCWLEGPPP